MKSKGIISKNNDSRQKKPSKLLDKSYNKKTYLNENPQNDDIQSVLLIFSLMQRKNTVYKLPATKNDSNAENLFKSK